MAVASNRATPKSSSILDRIFPNKNHPAIRGFQIRQHPAPRTWPFRPPRAVLAASDSCPVPPKWRPRNGAEMQLDHAAGASRNLRSKYHNPLKTLIVLEWSHLLPVYPVSKTSCWRRWKTKWLDYETSRLLAVESARSAQRERAKERGEFEFPLLQKIDMDLLEGTLGAD